MLLVVQTALELGFLYAPVALALFLSFRVLDIADLTTDGCFVLVESSAGRRHGCCGGKIGGSHM